MFHLQREIPCVLLTAILFGFPDLALVYATEDISIDVDRNVMVRMRDGVELATDIYYPSLNGKRIGGEYPAILERTPYSKKARFFDDAARVFTRHGFLFVVQDCRGRFESGGRYFPYHEAEDGFHTIQHLAQLPSCNGKVGMRGSSAHAWAQLAAAALKPPALVTIIPQQGPTNQFQDLMRCGGARHLSMLYLIAMLAANSPEAATSPEDADKVLQMIERDNFLKLLYQIPWKPGDTPLAKFPAYEDAIFEIFFDNHVYNEIWQSPNMAPGDHLVNLPSIPILWVTSWCDWNIKTNTGMYERLVQLGHDDQYLLLGPWPHAMFQSFAGDVVFEREAAFLPDYPSFWEHEARWFRRWLKGDQNVDLGPRVRYFLMGGGGGERDQNGRLYHGGQWMTADSWPPCHARPTAFYLREGKNLSTSPPEQTDSFTEYRYDPEQTACFLGRSWVPILTQDTWVKPRPGEMMAGPRDQIEVVTLEGHGIAGRRIAQRPDVLTFQTEPLRHNVTVVGNIKMSLWVSSDAPDTDFYVRLVDSYPASDHWPDGFDFPVSEGILRARYRNGFCKSDLMERGEQYQLQFSLEPTANAFQAGHRIRIYISSSNFPTFDVNRNQADMDSPNPRVALNRIYHDISHPSSITLSVVPD